MFGFGFFNVSKELSQPQFDFFTKVLCKQSTISIKYVRIQGKKSDLDRKGRISSYVTKTGHFKCLYQVRRS